MADTPAEHVIDASLARRLIATQFPQWSDLDVQPIEPGGWDNRTFRLGDRMTVRLPSAERYVPQVEREHRWLPLLAPQLPLPVPVPLAKGVAGEGFPWPWSVYRWLPGETLAVERVADLREVARDLARFLCALRQADATDGPPPGDHNFHRGGPPAFYDEQTRQALTLLDGHVDTKTAGEVWDAALAAPFQGAPVWFHGDIAWGQPAGRGRLFERGHRFRHLGHRRSRLRPRDRLDIFSWRKPGRLPGRHGARPGRLGTRPWLDTVESADRACRDDRRAGKRGGQEPCRDRRGARGPSSIWLIRRRHSTAVRRASFLWVRQDDQAKANRNIAVIRSTMVGAGALSMKKER